VQVLVLSLVFVGLYWLASMTTDSYMLRTRFTRRSMRFLAYVLAFVGILLLMWWGYRPDIHATYSWLRWIPWALSPLSFGVATSLLAEVRRVKQVQPG